LSVAARFRKLSKPFSPTGFALWITLYGKKKQSQKAGKCAIENDVWTVSGALRCPDTKTSGFCFGGVVMVQISEDRVSFTWFITDSIKLP
jgi:hypothetical protein